MIQTADFFKALTSSGFTFFAGVPDSLLKDICAFITDNVAAKDHLIAANEGAAVGLAAGYHLATGKMPVVYLQNSGTGNVVNPLLSLVDPEVYRMPVLFLIGWRGEPGVKDEPQHVKQGRVQLEMLKSLEVSYDIVDANSANFADTIKKAAARMKDSGQSHALLVRKDTFAPYSLQTAVKTDFPLQREGALEVVLPALEDTDLVVSTTGMASREVFEFRKRANQGHHRDFLTVGSMGHCSQIALGLAQNQESRQVFCIDGDGAVLMHMGGLATIGTRRPQNFKHVVINNGAHDSVGGQPTAGFQIDLPKIALACGYVSARTAVTAEEIKKAVAELRASPGPALLEIRVNKGARKDLGRPTSTPLENKQAFMKALGHEPS